MPNIYKINVSPKPLTNLTAVLTFTDDSTSTRTDWIEADTYYTITETTIKTLKSLTISANNYITQTLETSDLDIDITLSPNIKYVSKIKNNGVVYTLKDESVDSKIEGLANKTLSNVSSIDNNSAVATALNGKQATLVSGTNIKTINNNSLLGSGNITIDSLPSQSGQSGKFLTTNGTTASWSTVSIPTVDQIFDSTSTNAQSGVAIGNELVNYVNGRNGNIEINNDGTLADITYSYIDDNTLKEQYSVQVGATTVGHGALIGAMDYTDSQNLKEFGVAVVPEGFGISDGNQNVLLNISNNNLAVNGTEVALTTDIPDISTKQDTLVSGTNIKTVNNTSLLGSGNLSVGTVTSVNNTAPVNGNVTISIPTVNNATLTIQKNGTTVNTFTANSSSDVTANITVPTDTSDLTNNAGFITNSALSGYVQSTDLATVATSGNYNDLSNKPTIPNAQIQSDWNQTDNTAVDFIKNKPTIPSGVIVDQVYDGTSTNAQSGVAIAGELGNYVKNENNYFTIANNGTSGDIYYYDASGEMYGVRAGKTSYGDGVFLLSSDYTNISSPKTYMLSVLSDSIEFSDAVNQKTATLTVSSNNTLAVNGTEVALTSDIPTAISDLTDDTATNPVDKADTLTGLTATVTELNYTDGVTSNIQTQFNTITGKIPSQASTSNQLADKAFVNSSVQTATANFRGNWDTWALVPTSASSYPADYAGSTTPTVNDYLVVQDASDYTGDTLEGTWRFKYTGTWSTDGKSGWNPEYQVNETPLTSAQLAALNSGITSSDVTLIGTALQPNDNISELTNDSGYITGISSSDVTTALGYTPYNATNPSGYISGITSSDVTTALGYTPQVELTSGTNIKTVNNNSLLGSGNITIDSLPSQSGQSGKFLTTNGTTASWSTVSIPTVDQTFDGTSTNAQSGVAIEGELANYLQASNGNVTFTNGGTVGGITYEDSGTGEMYGTFIGYTPFGHGVMMGAVDPNGYLLGVTSSGINILKGTTTSPTNGIALTVTNNNTLAIGGDEVATQTWVGNQGYITSAALSTLTDVALSSPTQGQNLTYDATAGKWKNTSTTATVAWGGITGTLADQTDLNTALSGKQATLVSGTNIKTINSTSLLGSGNIEVLQNTATGTNSLTLLGTATSSNTAINIGYNSSTTTGGTVAIGTNANTSGTASISIGANTESSGIDTIAIGDTAKATANNAIQIGYGTNNTANKFNVRSYELLDLSTGYIPDARLSSNIARTSAIPTVPTNISAFTNDSGYITSSALTDYVTTNTDQNITGTKTYVGQKKIGFKQSSSSDKLGFTLYNNSGTEKGYLEYNPSNTVDSVPLMTLGNYATASGGLTHVGFRKYSSISGANGAYNLLAPLISDAKTPFSLTTTYTDFYLPLGFTNGSTTVKTAKSGMVDISTLLPSDYLQNTATGSNALTILGAAQTTGDGTNVGYSTSAGQWSNAFGNNAKATGRWSEVFGGNITVSGDWSVGIGHNNKISGNYTVAIGANLGGSSYETTGNYATCLGCYSNATADSAIQIGYGINSTANSLSIGFYNNSTTHYNWQLLDGTTGLIPDARISSNIARTSQIITPTYDSTNERITW